MASLHVFILGFFCFVFTNAYKMHYMNDLPQDTPLQIDAIFQTETIVITDCIKAQRTLEGAQNCFSFL